MAFGVGEDGRVMATGADEEAEALPVEGGAAGLDVPERGHEDRDLGVVVCEPDHLRGRPLPGSGRPRQGGGWRPTEWLDLVCTRLSATIHRRRLMYGARSWCSDVWVPRGATD